MKKCPNCGAIISDDSLFCGKCGCLLNKQQIKTPAGEQMNNNEDLLENNERNVRKYYVVAGGVVVLLVALGFYLFKSHGRQAGNQNMLDSLSDTISTMEMQDSVEVTEELSANDILKRHPGFQLLCSVSGDFDGDGKEETLYAINPKSDEGPHIEYVYFSKKKFPSIKVQTHGIYVPNSKPKNAGDLDGDGGDEIAFYSSGYSSSWNDYYIWSYKNGKWIVPIKPVNLPDRALEDGYVPVRKSYKKGYVEIDDNQEMVDVDDSVYNENTHAGLQFERKIVKFNNKGYKVDY